MAQSGESDERHSSWKSVAIGAAITVLVTVVSGLLVYFITREKPPDAPQEKLVYTIENSATFGSGVDGLTFLTVNVENAGTKAARNVRIVLPFAAPSRLSNHRISLSTGPAGLFDDKSDERQLFVRLDNLLPHERLKISALLNGPILTPPKISIRSDEAIGVLAPPLSLAVARKGDGREMVMLIIVIGAALVVQAVLFLLSYRSRQRRRSRIPEFPRCRNNSAFIFLLQGMASEADVLLSKEISDGEMEAVAWANQGLAKALLGDDALSKQRLQVADWLAHNDHDRSVIAFDRAILAAQNGELTDAHAFLQMAFEKEQTEISRYCELSVHIRRAMDACPPIKELVERNKAHPNSSRGKSPKLAAS